MGAGGGKTRVCLTKYLSYLSDPHFRGVVFRQSLPQLKVSGGIVDESHNIYPHFGGVFKSQAMKWVFPSGATLQFAAIGDDRDLPGWQGSQLTNVLIDEAAEWTEKQILFLLTRMRSATFKGKLQMVLSMNPNNQSWAFRWWAPLLDEETGIPRPGVEDIVRWFVVVNDKVQFGDTPEELHEVYGAGKTLGVDFIPKSVRIVPLSIYDNKPLQKANPEYLANLLSQSRINQLRFLHGSWTAVANGGLVWKTEWAERNLTDIKDVPLDCTWVRAYDLATAPTSSESSNSNDWSVSAKLGKSKSTGLYYVADVTRFRKTLFETLDEIANTAYADGIEDCQVVIPRDPGAGGLFASQYMVKELAERGIAVKLDVTSGHSSKMGKFLPFCSVSENNLVKWVKGIDWEDTWAELASFNGERSSNSKKDDRVDAISSAFKAIAKSNNLPVFSLPNSEFTRNSPLQQ